MLSSSLSSGDSSPSVDLSSATRCDASLVTTGQVEVSTEISPDDFDVSDSLSTWFNFFDKPVSGNQGATVTNGKFSVPMPQSSDAYDALANASIRCGRRMRIKFKSGTGSITSCAFTFSREIG